VSYSCKVPFADLIFSRTEKPQILLYVINFTRNVKTSSHIVFQFQYGRFFTASCRAHAICSHSGVNKARFIYITKRYSNRVKFDNREFFSTFIRLFWSSGMLNKHNFFFVTLFKVYFINSFIHLIVFRIDTINYYCVVILYFFTVPTLINFNLWFTNC
jgi:hypothetical protein